MPSTEAGNEMDIAVGHRAHLRNEADSPIETVIAKDISRLDTVTVEALVEAAVPDQAGLILVKRAEKS